MEKEISRLIQRYRAALKDGKEPYFDTDELDELLEYFESEKDYASFNKFAALGMKLHPDDVFMQIQECRGYIFSGDYSKALALIDTINGASVEELDMLRMECLCRMGQYDKIAEHMEELIRDNCSYLQDIFETLAPIIVEQGMDDEAFKFINRGLELCPDSFPLKDEKARLLEEFMDTDKAIRLCNSQLDKDPYDNNNWVTLGQLYADKGDFAKAIEALCFASACNDSEQDTELEMTKGYYLYMNGNYEKAIEVYNNICLTPDMVEENMEINSVTAKCYIEMGDFDKAYDCLKKIIDSNTLSNDPVDYLNFIHCCMETEHEENIPEVLDMISRMFPQDTNILSLMTATYRNIGRNKDSKDASERLLKILNAKEQLSSEEINTAFSTGRFFCMIGEVEESLRYFNTVKKFNPNHPMLQFYMALTYIMDGTIRNFDEQHRLSLVDEIRKRLEKYGFDADKIKNIIDAMVADDGEEHRVIPPENLTKEFLNNKGNIN